MADEVLTIAKAISDPTRLAVLRVLQASARSVGVQELADLLGVHHNAIRAHLAQLRDAGLVIESLQPRVGRGRPAKVYEADPRSADRLGGVNHYRTLATLLVDVAAGASPRLVGHEHGRTLAEQLRTHDPLTALMRVTEAEGFDPVVEPGPDGTDVVLRACPYEAAALRHRIVCDLHQAIAEGVVDHTDLEVQSLTVGSPQHGGCRIRLHPTSRKDTQ